MNMTYYSASVLKYSNPQSYITLGTDDLSISELERRKHPLLKIVDNVTYIKAHESRDPKFRSRYLKCNMRNLLAGDFVFLDSDVLPIKDLSIFNTIIEDVAAASNHSSQYPKNLSKKEYNIFIENSWKLPSNYYYNSGVIFWKDTNQAKLLGDTWLSKWLQSSVKGTHFDQPAFNSAINSLDFPVCLLSDKYNSQVTSNPTSSFDASIWHFYFSENEMIRSRTHETYGYNLLKKHNLFHLGMNRISNNQLTEDFLRFVCRHDIPFATPNSISKRRLKKVLESNNFKFDEVKYNLIMQNYLTAFALKLSTLFIVIYNRVAKKMRLVK